MPATSNTYLARMLTNDIFNLKKGQLRVVFKSSSGSVYIRYGPLEHDWAVFNKSKVELLHILPNKDFFAAVTP